MKTPEKGVVAAVCVSETRGTRKTPVDHIDLKENWGIENDAHAGTWHRQVSLLSLERIEEFRARGAKVGFGDFGENIVVSGFDFKSLPVGTRFRAGDVVLEMTQIGKECHSHCEIFKMVGDCIMPREGVFAKVIHGGRIAPGNEMILEETCTAAVITVSDRGSRGERTDTSGPAVCSLLEKAGYRVVRTAVIPDEREDIREELLRCTDERHCALVVTTGGTGFSPRDITPEVTAEILERPTPGLPERMRAESMKITPFGCLSRGTAGIRGRSLILNLPGSRKAAVENLEAVLIPLEHGLKMLFSEGSSDHGETVPVIGFAGFSGSGKTTLLEKLIPELKRQAAAKKIDPFRICVIKHDAHDLKLTAVSPDLFRDTPGKDSWRYQEAGADQVILCSRTAVYRSEGNGFRAIQASGEVTLECAVSQAKDVELVLVEGFKGVEIPQIGLKRKENRKDWTGDPDRFLAVVTDDPDEKKQVPGFGFEEIGKVAAFILEQAGLG